MKTILVPTDFSPAANNAAEYAIHFAKKIKANVLLLHIYNVPVAIAGDVPVMVATPKELQRENEMRLKENVTLLKRRTGMEVAYKAKMGLAGDDILEEEKNASFIIMGMHGAGKLSELLLGSITTAILRKAKTPVLVIPETVIYKDPERIVFASDYDPQTDLHTLETLKGLMKTFNSKVYVVNIKHKKENVSVEKAIQEARMESSLQDVEHFYYYPESDDLVDGINEFIANKRADMVTVIPHRYNAIERIFHKSISKKMAFHTQVPLLALPENHKAVDAYFI